jgi:hypothetical protein
MSYECLLIFINLYPKGLSLDHLPRNPPLHLLPLLPNSLQIPNPRFPLFHRIRPSLLEPLLKNLQSFAFLICRRFERVDYG